VLRRRCQGLDLRGSEKLAEAKGVGVRSCSCNEISSCTGGRCGLGEGEKGLGVLEKWYSFRSVDKPLEHSVLYFAPS
jgi:hypothetical protein